jgi:acyl-CoA thioesterase FadM
VSLILRLIRVVLSARLRGALGPLGESVLRFRVWPGDLDMNLHMNNGRYLSIMDFGRIDFIVRTGLWRHVWRRRWRPVVGAAMIHFRRSLRPFKTFQLRSRILGWDDKWFFIEQRFLRGDDLVAVGVVRALLRSRRINVPPAEVLAAVGHGGPSPALSPALAQWIEAERAVVDSARRDGTGG